MIISMFDNLYKQIKDNLFTMTCNDLFTYKNDFYDKCLEYKGDTKQLTGFTELLVGMYLKALNEVLSTDYELKSNVSKKGDNGSENEVDFSFLDASEKIIYGISVKVSCIPITFEKHELNTEIINKYRKASNIVQDLFRLNNIKKGHHGSFKSVTIIFTEVKSPGNLKIMSDISTTEEYQHSYIVLENNSNLFFDELKSKLEIQ